MRDGLAIDPRSHGVHIPSADGHTGRQMLPLPPISVLQKIVVLSR